MIPLETVLEIRRLHHVEEWPVGTIAEYLDLHHSTVAAALERIPTNQRRQRRSKTDPYVGFLKDQLAKHPRIRATRLYRMALKRGYDGSLIQLRRRIRMLRPPAAQTVHQRLVFSPGEQLQVDWGSFGQVRIGRAERPLQALVFRLSYSRATYFEFFLDQKLETLFLGHVRAFRDLGGVARELVYDNMKTVVQERRGTQVRFHPRLLELAIHYCFRPVACWPYHPQSKGGVERVLREIRESFFVDQSFTTLSALNRAALRWRDEVLHTRLHPTETDRTVAEVFRNESAHLTRLPDADLEVDLVRPVSGRKTMAIRFDRNDYTIPPKAVGRALTLVASDRQVRILDGTDEIARHERSYSQGEWIEDPAHRRALLAQRRGARSAPDTHLETVIPEARAFLDAAFQAGEQVASQVRQLNRLLRDYGAGRLREAIVVALERKTPHASSVAFILESHRRQSRRQAPLAVDFGKRPELGDYHVEEPSLDRYDRLSRTDEEDPDDDDGTP